MRLRPSSANRPSAAGNGRPLDMLFSALLALFVCLGLPTPARAQSNAQFTFPADQATGIDLSQVASWTAVGTAQAYYLYVGTTVGAKDLVDSGETTATSWPVCDVPLNQVVYARISTKIDGTWSSNDITFTAAASPSCRSALTTPSAGSSSASLGNGLVWSAVPNAQAYTLWIGTSPGASDVLNTFEVTSTSAGACDLPTSQLLYARLWTETGIWRFADSSFTASTDCRAALTYPATSGATQVSTSQPLTWTSVPGAQAYYLYVGTAVGLKDLVDTGAIQTTSYLASALPENQMVYVRLWTDHDGTWRYIDTTFTTARVRPTFLFPTTGASGVDLTTAIGWTSVPSADAYYLYVGTSSGATDVVNSGEISATAWTAYEAPLGQSLYARAYARVGGVWRYNEITFTAATAPVARATLVTPANGVVHADATQSFAWTRAFFTAVQRTDTRSGGRNSHTRSV